MKKTTKILIAVVLLVVMIPISGRGQTKMMCLEDTQQENYFLCTSEEDIIEILMYGEIEWTKVEKIEDEKIKKCLLTSENKSFSEVMLISETFENSSTRVQCVRIIVCCYNNRVLYIQKASEKLWWRATNILNTAEIIE